MSRSKRILITGGAGFIGFHLASHLSADAQTTIDLLDNLSRGKRDFELEALLSRPNVRLIAGDLTEAATFMNLPGEYDEVYHLAAILGVKNVVERPNLVLRDNTLSTLNLLEWFARCGSGKLLFSSTSEAYAWTQQFHTLPLPTPEDVPLALTDLKNPRSTYAGSKVFGELCVTQYCRTARRPYVIVRYHNVYGPRMGKEHVIPELYYRASRGENPLKLPSASHSRAFCYIEDAVRATVQAMREPAADGATINVGNDQEEITMAELAGRILREAGIAVEVLPQSNVHDPIVRRCPDISRARSLLGYRPTVSLDQGLRQTLAWYRARFASEAS